MPLEEMPWFPHSTWKTSSELEPFSKLRRRENMEKNPVNERRLRPLYESLDLGMNKKVIQDADKLLKKQPHITTAKALKALALERIGKIDECKTLMDALMQEQTYDEGALQVMSLCYRELHECDKIVLLLENITKKVKTEDTLTHLFMAYVRVGDFQKQHITGVGLYRQTSKPTYFIWAIISLLAKAEHCLRSNTEDKLSLPLAQRMFEKFMAEPCHLGHYDIWLYIDILWRQGNYEKIYEMVTTEDCMSIMKSKKTPLAKRRLYDMKIQVFTKLDKWNELKTYFENELVHPSAFVTRTQNGITTPYENRFVGYDYIKYIPKHFPEEAREFILNHYEVADEATLSTLLNLNYRFNHELSDSDEPGEILRILKLFCEKHSGLGSFYSDIKPFVKNMVGKKWMIEYVEALKENLTDGVVNAPWIRRTKSIGLLLSALEFNSWRDNFANLLKTFDWLMKQYLHGKSQVESDSKAGNKEDLPIDEICTQAAQLIFSFIVIHYPWKEDDLILKDFSCSNQTMRLKNHNYLIPIDHKTNGQINDKNIAPCWTVDWLEGYYSDQDFSRCVAQGLLEGPSMPDFRPRVAESDIPVLISLASLTYLNRHCSAASWTTPTGVINAVRLYNLIGASTVADEFSSILDIKYVQFDSLGYLFLWKPIYSCVTSENLDLLTHAENFYSSYKREHTEFLVNAYKYGSWDRVIEFTQFRDSLMTSLQHLTIETEKQLLSVNLMTSSPEVVLKLSSFPVNETHDLPETFEDHRDFSVFEYRNVLHLTDLETLKENSLKAAVLKLKIRRTLVNLLRFLIHEGRDAELFETRVPHILADLKIMDLAVDSIVEVMKKSNLGELMDYHIYSYATMDYEMFKYFFQYVMCLLRVDCEESKILPDMAGNLVKVTKLRTAQMVKAFCTYDGTLLRAREVMEAYYSICEMFGFAALMLDTCFEKYKHIKAKKKNKRQLARFQGFKDVVETLDESFNVLISSYKFFMIARPSHDDSISFSADEMSIWTHFVSPKVAETVLQGSVQHIVREINDCYENSLRSISANLDLKHKILKVILENFSDTSEM